MFVKLLLSFQQNDLLIYSKLSQAYYSLLETLTADHMNFVSMLEPQVFLYILSSISDGLAALDSVISTNCCSSLDHILTYLFKIFSKQKRQPQQQTQQQSVLLQIYQQQPQVFQQVLTTVVNIIIFEDCRNQWSMSRPLLGLILLNEQFFEQWRNNLVAAQSADRRESAENCINNLMSGVERSLSLKNRDKFTQNIATFRRDINECLKSNHSSNTIIQKNGSANGSK